VPDPLTGAGHRRCAQCRIRFSSRFHDTSPTAHDTAVVATVITVSQTRLTVADVSVGPLYQRSMPRRTQKWKKYMKYE